MFFDEHQAIGTDSEFPVTKYSDLIGGKVVAARQIVNQHEIIAGCLIFREVYFHGIQAIAGVLRHQTLEASYFTSS